MDRVDLVLFATVRFAKLVDLHPRLPLRCAQFKRVIHEWEYFLEDPDFWESDLPSQIDDYDNLCDANLLLAQIDAAGGGWHRS